MSRSRSKKSRATTRRTPRPKNSTTSFSSERPLGKTELDAPLQKLLTEGDDLAKQDKWTDGTERLGAASEKYTTIKKKIDEEREHLLEEARREPVYNDLRTRWTNDLQTLAKMPGVQEHRDSLDNALKAAAKDAAIGDYEAAAKKLEKVAGHVRQGREGLREIPHVRRRPR